MSGLLRGAGTVIRKDLLAEGRAGEVLRVTIPFGALALLLFPLSINTNFAVLRQIGPGIYWAIVLLFGILVTLRATAADSPQCRDLLLLSGVQPASIFLGRTAAGSVLLLLFELVLAPVMVVFYSPDGIAGWPWLFVLAALVAVGLSTLGTLAATLSIGLRTRSAIAPLLVAPLAAPILLAATETTDLLGSGQGIIRWILLLVAMDLALIIAGMLVAGSLEESMQ
ncbi:MAG TPA: ABC transporter permease [Actinobacteria bacterium]|nr:ABC transporter permease [Actinomycetota bacterium]